MDKDKKKTLTISSDLKKKIDTSSISTSSKKSFSVKKKSPLEEIKIITDQIKILILRKLKILKRKIMRESLLSNRQLRHL